MNIQIAEESECKYSVKSGLIRVLRYLARLALKYGISSCEFNHLANDVYQREKRANKTKNEPDSDLSRRSPAQEDNNLPHIATARVLSGWCEDPLFYDEKMQPKVLPYSSMSTYSFVDLVQVHGGHFDPQVVLRRLLESGCVIQQTDNRLQLKKRSYVPNQNEEDILNIGFSSASELLATVLHNSSSDGDDRWLQQAISSATVPEKYCERL
ncbi:MAG: DUF6502 family protein, partial [Gammaproteobacteria bacterium]|nr:DUF6502 family protein [Gammaproteobacteria bacterium]